MVVAHGQSISIIGSRDNFTQRQTVSMPLSQENSDSECSTLDDFQFSLKALAYSDKDRKLYAAGTDRKIHVWAYHAPS